MTAKKCYVDLTKSNVLIKFIDHLKLKDNSISDTNIIVAVHDYFYLKNTNNNSNLKNGNKLLTFIEFKNNTNIIELLQDILYSDSSSEDETDQIDIYLEKLYSRYVYFTKNNKKPTDLLLTELKIIKMPENKINDSAVAGPSNYTPMTPVRPTEKQDITNNDSAVAGPSNYKPMATGRPSTERHDRTIKKHNTHRQRSRASIYRSINPPTLNDSSLSDSSGDCNIIEIDSSPEKSPLQTKNNVNNSTVKQYKNLKIKNNIPNKNTNVNNGYHISEIKTQEFFLNKTLDNGLRREEEPSLPQTINLPIDEKQTENINSNEIQNIKDKLNKIQTNITLKRKLNLNMNPIIIPFKKPKVVNTVEECHNSDKKIISFNFFKNNSNIKLLIHKYCLQKLDIDVTTVNIDFELKQYYEMYTEAIKTNTPLKGLLKCLKFKKSIKMQNNNLEIKRNASQNTSDKEVKTNNKEITSKLCLNNSVVEKQTVTNSKVPEKITPIIRKIINEKSFANFNTSQSPINNKTGNSYTLTKVVPKETTGITMPKNNKNINEGVKPAKLSIEKNTNEKQIANIVKAMVPSKDQKIPLKQYTRKNINAKPKENLNKSLILPKQQENTAISNDINNEKQTVNTYKLLKIVPRDLHKISKQQNVKQTECIKEIVRALSNVNTPSSMKQVDQVEKPEKQFNTIIHNVVDFLVPASNTNKINKPADVKEQNTSKHNNENKKVENSRENNIIVVPTNKTQAINKENANNKVCLPITKENILKANELQKAIEAAISNVLTYRNLKREENREKNSSQVNTIGEILPKPAKVIKKIKTSANENSNGKLKKKNKIPDTLEKNKLITNESSSFIAIPYKIFRNETNIEMSIKNKLKKIFKNVDDEPKHRIENMIYMYYQACIKNKESLPPGLYFNRTKSKTLNLEDYKDYNDENPIEPSDVSSLQDTIEFIPLEDRKNMESLIVSPDYDPLSMTQSQHDVESQSEKKTEEIVSENNIKTDEVANVKAEPLNKSTLNDSILSDSDSIEMFDVINPILVISDDENNTEPENTNRNSDCSPLETSLLSRLENNLLNKQKEYSPVTFSSEILLTQSTKSCSSTQFNSTNSLFNSENVNEDTDSTSEVATVTSHGMLLKDNLSLFNATELVNYDKYLNISSNNNKIIENLLKKNPKNVKNFDKRLKIQEIIERKFFTKNNCNKNSIKYSYLRDFSINNVNYVNRKIYDRNYDVMNDFFIKINYNYFNDLIINGNNIKLIFNLNNNEYDALKYLLTTMDSFHYEKRKEKSFLKKHFTNYDFDHIIIYYLIKTLSPIPNFLLNINNNENPCVMNLETILTDNFSENDTLDSAINKSIKDAMELLHKK